MKIKTYLGGYETSDFEPIPPGIYEARIVHVSHEEASTGTKFLSVEFEILGSDQAGRHVWGNCYLTENARWKCAALLKAAGLPLEDELEIDLLMSGATSKAATQGRVKTGQ